MCACREVTMVVFIIEKKDVKCAWILKISDINILLLSNIFHLKLILRNNKMVYVNQDYFKSTIPSFPREPPYT